MLYNYSSLYGIPVQGTDRSIGTLWDILFDDHTGKINYFVVNISGWLFGKHVLIIPEKCSIQNGSCIVSMSSEEIRRSPDESVDPPVYLQEKTKRYSAFIITPGISDTTFGFPLYSAAFTAIRADNESGAETRLRSIGETTAYSVKEPASERICGQISDAAIRDREWFVDHFIANVITRDGFSRTITIPFNHINKILFAEAAISLNTPCCESVM